MAIDLDAVRALLAAATPGPWEAVQRDDPRGQPVPYYRGVVALVTDGLSVVAETESVPSSQWAGNAELISAAPQLLAALVEEVAGLRREQVSQLECTCDAFTVVHFGPDAHDGAGWYYWDDNYPDEGSVGAFATLEAAEAHARPAYEPECEIHGAVATRLYALVAARDARIAVLEAALAPLTTCRVDFIGGAHGDPPCGDCPGCRARAALTPPPADEPVSKNDPVASAKTSDGSVDQQAATGGDLSVASIASTTPNGSARRTAEAPRLQDTAAGSALRAGETLGWCGTSKKAGELCAAIGEDSSYE